MYQISRALYRNLSDDIIQSDPASPGRNNHQRVLEACEATVHRLATDPYYFARPARTLLREIRCYFPLAALQRVGLTVEHHLAVASELLARDPGAIAALTGHRLGCRAWVRKGRPCQRAPRFNGYCPSHRHLAEDRAPVAGAVM